MIEKELVSWLLADANIVALLDARLRAGKLKQGDALPAARYALIGSNHPYDTAGPANMVQRRIQIDSYGDTQKEARDLSATIRTRLNAFRGSHNGVEVRSVTLDDEQVFFEETTDGQDAGAHRVTQDWLVWHSIS